MARAVASAFSKAGLSLRVQNFAVGGGRTMPTTGWCGISQVGPEVDLAICKCRCPHSTSRLLPILAAVKVERLIDKQIQFMDTYLLTNFFLRVPIFRCRGFHNDRGR